MFSIFLDVLNVLSNNSGLLLVVITAFAVYFAYKEIVLRHRPYVIPEITYEIKQGKWFFHVLLVNKGEKPGIVKIDNALLVIGDEKHPTDFNFEAVLAPNEKKKLAPIGHINESGRKKIIGNEYRFNRMEIFVEVSAKAVKDKKFKYRTRCEYKVEVNGDSPQIELIREEIT
jgi:hypothetical protein